MAKKQKKKRLRKEVELNLTETSSKIGVIRKSGESNYEELLEEVRLAISCFPIVEHC